MDKEGKGKFGEDAVNEIASLIYLKYWCFPSPKDENGDKKEICDLLILFRNSAIIISVKNYEFKGNYERYFNSTLAKASRQIHGAERKLFQSQQNITFNHPITGTFFFIPSEYSIVHRIIVNLSTLPLFYPGSVDIGNKFIHVFNWFGFLKLVQELDTIPDFIQYLNEREKLFKNKDLLLLPGEENNWSSDVHSAFMNYTSAFNPTKKSIILVSGHELDVLADYLTNARKFSTIFYSDKYNGGVFQLDDKWKEYLNRKEVIRKKEEDRISYFLDEFIEREILFYNNADRIKIATELLALSRFERRMVGKNFYDFLGRHRNKGDFFMAKAFTVFGDLTISFFIHGNGVKIDSAMNLMQIAVQGYSHWEGYKSKRILMIGANIDLTQFKFAYTDSVRPLAGIELDDLNHSLKVLNWFQNLKTTQISVDEYPKE